MASRGLLLWERRFSLAGSNRGEHDGPGFVCKSVWLCVISCLGHNFFFLASGSGGVQAPDVAASSPGGSCDKHREEKKRHESNSSLKPAVAHESVITSVERARPPGLRTDILPLGKGVKSYKKKKKKEKGLCCGFKDPPTTCSASTSH